jgi:hypothetical protein
MNLSIYVAFCMTYMDGGLFNLHAVVKSSKGCSFVQKLFLSWSVTFGLCLVAEKMSENRRNQNVE